MLTDVVVAMWLAIMVGFLIAFADLATRFVIGFAEEIAVPLLAGRVQIAGQVVSRGIAVWPRVHTRRLADVSDDMPGYSPDRNADQARWWSRPLA